MFSRRFDGRGLVGGTLTDAPVRVVARHVRGDRERLAPPRPRTSPRWSGRSTDRRTLARPRRGLGIELAGARPGPLSLARADAFLQDMVKTGLYKAGEVDLKKVVSERFAPKG